MSNEFNALWISDIHLGTSAARPVELTRFLDRTRADRVYLVGDIIDLERMRSRPQFPESHVLVIAKLVSLANSATEVIFIPGNHDHQFRHLVGRDICGIPVHLEATHTTRAGKRLLVTHGDILDGRIRKGTNLEKFGAAAYGVMIHLDAMINQLRTRLGHDYLSLSSQLKRRLSSANEYIRRFEEVAAAYAAERGYDGIVCGHIHRPGIRQIDGITYANDGDWVEHRTALAEDRDGSLRILAWDEETSGSNAIAEESRIAA